MSHIPNLGIITTIPDRTKPGTQARSEIFMVDLLSPLGGLSPEETAESLHNRFRGPFRGINIPSLLLSLVAFLTTQFLDRFLSLVWVLLWSPNYTYGLGFQFEVTFMANLWATFKEIS